MSKLVDYLAPYVFKNLTNWKEGVTVEEVKTGLSGFDETLKALSDKDKTALFEETPVLKSHLDGRVTGALEKKQAEYAANLEAERKKLTDEIIVLKAKLPEDDLETLKQSWLDATPEEKANAKLRYEVAQLRHENEEAKKIRTEAEAKERAMALREVAKSSFGDRKLPEFFKIDTFLGSDEDETKVLAEKAAAQYDEFIKTVRTGDISPETPPDAGDKNYNLAEAMSSAGDF